MRLIVSHPNVQPLEVKDDRLFELKAYLDRAVEDSASARFAQDQVWREALRQYEGVPRNPVRNVPIENAPNVEVTIGGTLTDAMYAQIIDLIFNISPPLTTRAIGVMDYPERKERAIALQEHINHGVVLKEWNVREAVEETCLDDVKLGTGVFFIPFVEQTKKTRTRDVTFRGPRIISVPPEDFFVPGGADSDLQMTKWCATRHWMNDGELFEQALAEEWDIEGVQAVGAIGWVRHRREILGRTWRANVYADVYEIWRLYCYFDIDGDGTDEDLLVIYDRTSRKILHVEYNGYDCRPLEKMVYQRRGHLAYGLGVMDMVAGYQQEASDVHSYALANALLANARFWKGRDGSLPETMHIWPGKYQTMADPGDLEAVQMADIYPSMLMMQTFPIGLAQERVGQNSIAQPNRGNMPRTPGITALSLLNQANKRFTPALDGVRLAVAGAIRQCLYRESERLLGGDRDLEEHLIKIHGPTRGGQLIAALKDPDFELEYAIEVTASSGTMNREVERQNAILIINVLGQYYQRVLELTAISSNPQTPEAVRETAKKVAQAASEIVERALRTFDQVRDPEQFIVDINDQIDKGAADVPKEQIFALAQQLIGPLLGGNVPQGEITTG